MRQFVAAYMQEEGRREPDVGDDLIDFFFI
jgi:hypothetical protein